ncbi:MAG: quinone-dependent dihydroorotate dehydrogenase [Rhodobacteraceae bacterium]|nr:quinone-dependent dihydroorotate dehydrogenase [Paracoccaceae bacterium]
MILAERVARAVLHRIDPEQARDLALIALRARLTPRRAAPTSDRLRTTVAGINLLNPVGLAAGFDKNAIAIAPLLKSGFGFIEVGTVTPHAQSGNPKPRLFRLAEDRAAINRFGFSNDGAAVIARRLAARPATGVVGLNIGPNRDSRDRVADFTDLLKTCGAKVNFVTVNVSSPNTEKLRDLQGAESLARLLDSVLTARDGLGDKRPGIFLKVSPDLTDADIRNIAAVARNARIDAVIATNTTLRRDGLSSRHATEAGGLSGAPLRTTATRILAKFYGELKGDVPLIGVGGIATAQDALDRIRAGAQAIQIYTALIYDGITGAVRIAEKLDSLLAKEGFQNVSEAVGNRP